MEKSTFLKENTEENHVVIDLKSQPPSPKEKRVRLKTVGDVSHELGKLYREARNGRVDVAGASKLANMLSILSRILETSNLELRVEELERQKGGSLCQKV